MYNYLNKLLMSEVSATIVENMAQVRGRIAAAAVRSGRMAEDVTLVAVTKYVSDDVTRAVFEAGCRDLGESRPQQLWDKASHLADLPIHWHMIGHLQRNKVRRTIPLVSMIHSVDSVRLLAEIDAELKETTGQWIAASEERAGDRGQGAEGRKMGGGQRAVGSESPNSTPQPLAPNPSSNPQSPILDPSLPRPALPILLEVNTSGEEAKHGFRPAEIEPLLDQMTAYQNVQIRGLMCMAGLEGDMAAARRDFAALRQLRDRLRRNCPPRVSFEELSMGMSGDFEVAIEEGATIVRVGSLLFEGK